jgi:hypothetical protein
MTLNSTPQMQAALNDTTADTFARTVGNGLYSVTRTTNIKKLLKNGTVLGTVNPSTPDTAPSATLVHIFDGAYGSTGLMTAAYIGGYLNDSEVAALASIIEGYDINLAPAVTFIGASTPVYGTGAINVTVHADTQPNDLLILVKASGGNDNPAIAGWTGIGGSNFHVGGGVDPNGIGVNCSRSLATGAGQVIAIPDSGGHNEAIVLTFRAANEGNIGFSSTNYQATGGTNIVAPGSAAFTVGDLGMFVYAGRGTMSSPSVVADANWANESVVANIANSVSMAIAIAEVDAASTKTFLTGQWTGSATHRVAVALRVRPYT